MDKAGTVRRVNRQRRGKRRRVTIASVVFAVLIFVAAAAADGVIGSRAERAFDRVWQHFSGGDDPTEAVANGFPGELEVSFGSANDPTAMFPAGRPQTARPAGYNEHLQWIWDNGGTLAGPAVISLTFGPTPAGTKVQIRKVTVRHLTCSPPETGYYDMGPGAGDLFGRIVDTNLDTQPIQTTLERDDGSPWQFPLWVDSVESDSITVWLDPTAGKYRVALTVEYSSDGRDHILELDEDDEGRAFVVTSNARATSHNAFPGRSDEPGWDATYPGPPERVKRPTGPPVDC
ncbi:hypothetical protein ACIRN4_26690 [Pimelobacter simplex]|uniref:hypothetical protein n=1 Tax=Nocardioides simplex TaxID=2045 RepID=UPI00381D335E